MVGIDKVKVRFPSLALAHVSHFFSEREPWALKQSTHFSVFERFEILCLPDLLVSLAPSSPSEQNFDAFSSFVRLFRSFQVHVQGVRAIVHLAMQVHAVQSRTVTHTRPRHRLRSSCADLHSFAISKCSSFGAPPHIFVISENLSVRLDCLALAHVSHFVHLSSHLGSRRSL